VIVRYTPLEADIVPMKSPSGAISWKMAVAKKPAKQRVKSAAAPKAVPKKKASVQIGEAPASSNDTSAGKFAVGDQVSHPMFGKGTVVAIDAGKLTIEFADQIIRQIVDYYVKKSK
jgi:hypothetical protein